MQGYCWPTESFMCTLHTRWRSACGYCLMQQPRFTKTRHIPFHPIAPVHSPLPGDSVSQVFWVVILTWQEPIEIHVEHNVQFARRIEPFSVRLRRFSQARRHIECPVQSVSQTIGHLRRSKEPKWRSKSGCELIRRL